MTQTTPGREKYNALRSKVVTLLCRLGYGRMAFDDGLNQAIEDWEKVKVTRYAKR